MVVALALLVGSSNSVVVEAEEIYNVSVAAAPEHPRIANAEGFPPDIGHLGMEARVDS